MWIARDRGGGFGGRSDGRRSYGWRLGRRTGRGEKGEGTAGGSGKRENGDR